MSALLIIVAAGCALWFHFDQEALPALVDDARATFGPEAVAQVESLVFNVQDLLGQARYQLTGTAPDVQWADPPAQVAGVGGQGAPTTAPAIPTSSLPAAPTTTTPASPSSAVTSPTATEPPTVTGPNWLSYVNDANGAPLMERMIVAPDPSEPYVRAALVRIDLSHTQLHLVAGSIEPITDVPTDRTGTIPPAVLTSGTLLAAFNGGFKTANGHYGIAVDGTTLLPPQDGIATLAIYRDGSVRLGVWGEDITPSPAMIAFRQNCPLLLNHSAPTAQAEDPNSQWGKTIGNKVRTWRSGLGMLADGHSLIYAVGEGLTVPALAEALRQGGAVRGMQLDVNSHWTQFVTFAPGAKGTLEPQKLLDNMYTYERQFIITDSRDFFYLTRGSPSEGAAVGQR